jgi:hypothetical protein
MTLMNPPRVNSCVTVYNDSAADAKMVRLEHAKAHGTDSTEAVLGHVVLRERCAVPPEQRLQPT